MTKFTRISLLEFAIRHIKKTNDELRICHTNSISKIIDDEDVAEEVFEVKQWIKEAKVELRRLKKIDRGNCRPTLIKRSHLSSLPKGGPGKNEP